MMLATSTLALPTLPVVQARVSYRLLAEANLPIYLGAVLRGGFGTALQRVSCPPECWGMVEACSAAGPCAYRRIFETPRAVATGHLHDLRDVPRPFVIEPPRDGRTIYAAGEVLEFGLVLIGRGIDDLPYFLFAFEQLGRLGLGNRRVPARLERVEVLRPGQPVGQVVYRDGQLEQTQAPVLVLDLATVVARAAALPARLALRLDTPLRLKSRGGWLQQFDLAVLVQAICWRLDALATFHGAGPWGVDYGPLVAAARAVEQEPSELLWVDWARTSTRGAKPQHMDLGGLVGTVRLREVPAALRAILLAGSLVHVGKACVFGHGHFTVEGG